MRLSLSVATLQDLQLPAIYARIRTRRGYFALNQAGIAGMVTTELLRTTRRFQVEVVAYCVMPDCLSVLVAGTQPGAHAHDAIRRWKQVSGAAHRLRAGRTLWQPRTPVWPVESVSAILEVAAYLVLEPVRLGVVRAAEDYQWLSAPPAVLAHLFAKGKRPQAPHWWPPETTRVTSERRTGRSSPR
jgi:hypothetical protein